MDDGTGHLVMLTYATADVFKKYIKQFLCSNLQHLSSFPLYCYEDGNISSYLPTSASQPIAPSSGVSRKERGQIGENC